MRNAMKCAAAAALLVLPVSQKARAAQITWGSQSLIAGPSDVVTQGSSVYAYAVGNSNSPLVNGVLFNGAISHDGSPDYDYSDSNVLLHNYIEYQSFGTPPTVSDSQYAALLDSAGYAPNAHNDITYTLNVTSGQKYLLEMWVNDGRAGAHVGSTETLTDTSGGASGTLTLNQAYGTAGYGGTFITGTFTADSSSENVVIDGGDIQQINAFQLRNITTPEPATGMLFAIGSLGLLARRRATP